MSKVLSHKENENENVIQFPSYPTRNGYHQENEQQMLVGTSENETLYILFYGM
jgi:hypothetical protein